MSATFTLPTSWANSYREIFEGYYGALMSQTHLKDLYDTITYTWDEEKQEDIIDTSGLIAALEDALAYDPQKGRELLSEFARSRRGMGFHDENCFLSLREHFILQDLSLGWVFDTGGLNVYDGPGHGMRPWSGHIEGTNNADAVRGSLTEGDGTITGLHGNDVVYGTSRNELLIHETGNALLVAGSGDDMIWAGAGDDILDGGAGYDKLYGEAGNDTYILRIGSDHDTIYESDPTPGNTDTIWLGSNLTPDDITLKRAASHLVITIDGTDDSLTVSDHFRWDRTLNRIEQIQFMDGTVWNEDDIYREAHAPTDGDDYIYGWDGVDDLHGAGGNDHLFTGGGDDALHGDDGDDYLHGGTGDDTLDGGSGDDYLVGERGSDTYLLAPDSGNDTIYEPDTTPGSVDTLQLAPGILPSDVELARERIYNQQIRKFENHLKLTIIDTGDTITVNPWLEDDTPAYGVEIIQFEDGTAWDTEAIQDILVLGTEGDDTIYGFSGADTIIGLGGNDSLHGLQGDDTRYTGALTDGHLILLDRPLRKPIFSNIGCDDRWLFPDMNECIRFSTQASSRTSLSRDLRIPYFSLDSRCGLVHARVC
ncbi:calcium-binding protein [Thermodesulfobacteriota bacterium]